MGILAYVGAVGAVLALSWLAQHGPPAGGAAADAAQRAAQRRTRPGGGELIPIEREVFKGEASPVYGSYQYDYGEQPGGTTCPAPIAAPLTMRAARRRRCQWCGRTSRRL